VWYPDTEVRLPLTPGNRLKIQFDIHLNGRDYRVHTANNKLRHGIHRPFATQLVGSQRTSGSHVREIGIRQATPATA
jgi:hypothetical protein